jgi:hypothetical protein
MDWAMFVGVTERLEPSESVYLRGLMQSLGILRKQAPPPPPSL